MQYNFHFVNLVFKWGNINCSPFTLRYAHIFIALLNESNERKASRLICVVIFFSSHSAVRSFLPWKKIKKKKTLNSSTLESLNNLQKTRILKWILHFLSQYMYTHSVMTTNPTILFPTTITFESKLIERYQFAFPMRK